MTSISKKKQEINNSLDTLYQVNNGATIISWLDMLKTYNSTDGKIPGLLNSSKIQINTAKKDGVYNLILLWIKKNMDKFANYDFTGIPNKDFLFLDKQRDALSASVAKKLSRDASGSYQDDESDLENDVLDSERNNKKPEADK